MKLSPQFGGAYSLNYIRYQSTANGLEKNTTPPEEELTTLRSFAPEAVAYALDAVDSQKLTLANKENGVQELLMTDEDAVQWKKLTGKPTSIFGEMFSFLRKQEGSSKPLSPEASSFLRKMTALAGQNPVTVEYLMPIKYDEDRFEGMIHQDMYVREHQAIGPEILNIHSPQRGLLFERLSGYTPEKLKREQSFF